MPGVKVTITHFADPYPPGLVGCEFVDADGQVRRFIEKFYYVSGESLDETSRYPQPGILECEVIARAIDSLGREIVEIETACHRLEDEIRFRVFPDQLTEHCFR
jgi:hypothetical protein